MDDTTQWSSFLGLEFSHDMDKSYQDVIGSCKSNDTSSRTNDKAVVGYFQVGLDTGLDTCHTFSLALKMLLVTHNSLRVGSFL